MADANGSGWLGPVLAGIGSILGGSGGPSASDKLAKRQYDESRVREFKYTIERYGKNSGQFEFLRKKYPDLWRQIEKGKFGSIFDPRAPLPGKGAVPKPVRPGDIPLRTPVDKLPPVGGTMRRIAGVGALGGGLIGAASWAVWGGSFVPESWWRTAGRQLGKYGAALGAQGTKGGSFPKRVVPAKGPNRLMGPPPPPAGAPPRAAAMPVGSSPSGTSAAPGVPAPAPAAKGTPITLAAPPPTKPWWELALPLLASLLTKDGTSKASRTIVNVGPFANAPQPSTDPAPGLDPLTPLEPGSACSCPTKKPAKPKKPRTECRTGRFIERFSGLQKYDTRRVTCRPSKKRLP